MIKFSEIPLATNEQFHKITNIIKELAGGILSSSSFYFGNYKFCFKQERPSTLVLEIISIQQGGYSGTIYFEGDQAKYLKSLLIEYSLKNNSENVDRILKSV